MAKVQAVDPNMIAANLGHKDATLVMRIYGKYRPREADFARLGHLFGHSAPSAGAEKSA